MIKAKIAGKRVNNYNGKESVEIYFTYDELGTQGVHTGAFWMPENNEHFAELVKSPLGTDINVVRVGFGKNAYYQFVQIISK